METLLRAREAVPSKTYKWALPAKQYGASAPSTAGRITLNAFLLPPALFVPESDISVYSALVSGRVMLPGVVYLAPRLRNAVVDPAVGITFGLAGVTGQTSPGIALT